MKILSQGWLNVRPDLLPLVNGIYIPEATRTRKEEYTFALNSAPSPPGTLLDVACGYVPEWHLFPVIMAEAGWIVVAVDKHPEVHKLPEHSAICYRVADGRAIPFESEKFDYVTCISTLEHVDRRCSRKIVAEMERCCKPGGRLLATADDAPWLPVLFGGEFDITEAPWPGLNPSVYFVVAEK